MFNTKGNVDGIVLDQQWKDLIREDNGRSFISKVGT